MKSSKAFTLIELIFVIVIISILAVIAIPKLSATRSDAINAKDCKNISVCISDMLAQYTAMATATKSDSEACTRAENSSQNDIDIGVGSDEMTVDGSPEQCDYLNGKYKFGGSRVSID